MTAGARIVVTAGPTISPAEIRAVVPNAEVVPPISFGQALGYGLRQGDTLLIVDGLFLQHAPVRHKELLTLIADGVRVIGCSSMGALRAAELHPFGMEGYGWVFEGYRYGLLEADDEVAMVHGEPDDGYPVFVDALVNMRHTVIIAVTAGVLDAPMADQIIEAARVTPFTLRTWDRLLADVGAPDIGEFARQLRTLRVDIKHADALFALNQIAREPRRGAVRAGPPATMWSQRWRQSWAPPTPVAIVADDGGQSVFDVSDHDVLSLLTVCATDRWAYLPALEQVAAWYWTHQHPDQHGTVRERASRAVAEVEAPYQCALEIVAHRYALATGIIDVSGFPEQVRSQWLTAEENHYLGHNPIAVSARVTTRSLFFAHTLPATQHFLDLLREDPRLEKWRAMAAQALSMRDELAREKPHLNLLRPHPKRLKHLFAARWGAPVDRIEVAKRGLFTMDFFYSAATVFAVAAAADKLPFIEVGRLGTTPTQTPWPSDTALIAGN